MAPQSVLTALTPRIILSRLFLAGLLATIAVASGAAVLVEDDGIDTALGAVTGAAAVFLLLALLLQVLTARADRRARDRRALDGLEPLRAARRDFRRLAPRATPGAGPQAGPGGPSGPRRDDGRP